MPYLDIDNRKIFYNDTGDGAPLVLLHNGFYSSVTWDPVRQQLAERFRVIDYDRYGYGRSTQMNAPPDDLDIVEEGVVELGRVLDALAIKRARIIGHCLGGAIALLYTARNPERVSHIVAASVGYFGSLKSLISTDMTFVPFERIEAVLKKKMVAMHGEAYSRTLWSYLSNHKDSYIMTERYDIRKEVARIKTPMLIANGDRDFYFEPDHPMSVFKKVRKTADLWIAPHTGHDIHMEQPELFIDAVLRFLK